jgi:acyl-[acyl carrier protein]--UDP-N-acetylglucosamine O-acyltransferase
LPNPDGFGKTAHVRTADSGVPLELRGLGSLRLKSLRAVSAVVLGYHRLAERGRIQIGPGVVANHRLRVRGPGLVRIGERSNLYAFLGRTRLYTRSPGARIEIGRNVRLNGTTIQAASLIQIGDDCILGDANVMDTDMHPVGPERRHDPDAVVHTAPVVLERNVWVGGQAAVLPGVRIGENSVVGFRAVVTVDVPANVVVAGNPARVVRAL